MISVIIPTYNRAQYLESCLASLEKQTYDRKLFEVIVINDGSTDDTGAFLDRFKRVTGIDLTIITQPNRGVSFARNAGISRARGGHIAFTDDDCIVPGDWLERMARDIRSAGSDAAGIGGPLDCIAEGKSAFVARFIQYLDEFNHIPVLGKYFIRPVHVSKLKGDEPIPYLRTSNVVFRKSCLTETGGFDADFRRPGGEDPDLCYRILGLGYSFFLDRNLVVAHRSRASLASYFRSLKNYLRGEIRIVRKKHLYKNRIVQRTYSLIPAQKLVSFLLSAFSYPLAVLKLFRKREYPLSDKLLFPFIIILSKLYALAVSCYYFLSRPESRTS